MCFCFFFVSHLFAIDNEAGVHDMRVDDMEPDDDLDEDDRDLDEHDDKLSLDGRKLRKRARPFFCEDDDGDSSAPEHDDDLDDADGPENLCIKNNRDTNNDGVSNNNNNKDNNSSSNSNSNNNNRIGLGKRLCSFFPLLLAPLRIYHVKKNVENFRCHSNHPQNSAERHSAFESTTFALPTKFFSRISGASPQPKG